MAQPTAVDHYCKTADGTLCRVMYLSGPAFANAELRSINADGSWGDNLTLPLAELRRVADPRNKRPPVEGLPAERPHCPWCDRPLRMLTNHLKDPNAKLWLAVVKRRVFVRWQTVEGVFCTNSCAIRFAGASYRGGFRRVKK